MEVVRTDVEAREASKGIKINSAKSQSPPNRLVSRNQNSTANTLSANHMKVKCVYCNGDHFSASCSKVRAAKRNEGSGTN